LPLCSEQKINWIKAGVLECEMNAEVNAQVKMNAGFLSMDGDDENEEAKYSLAYQKAQGKRAEMQVRNITLQTAHLACS
jgi:hypothetical protein